jgi:hypothetical protein
LREELKEVELNTIVAEEELVVIGLLGAMN